jgi:hypothetical protein
VTTRIGSTTEGGLVIVDRRPHFEPGEWIVLARNSDGQWGTAVEFDEEELSEPVDEDDCIWFIDEATARRDFMLDPTLATSGCDACGREMDSAVARQSPEGNVIVCPACWVCGGDESVEVTPEQRVSLLSPERIEETRARIRAMSDDEAQQVIDWIRAPDGEPTP